MPRVPIASVVFLLGATFSGCGARSGLLDDERGDAGSPVARPDAAASLETCVAGEPFEVVRTTGPIVHPRLARRGNDALLVFTRGSIREILAMPIDLRGRSRGAPQLLGDGNGGTLLGRTLDDAPGFTLSYTNPDGLLTGVRLNLDGRLAFAAGLDAMTDTDRPLLVITPEFVVNGWNGATTGEGFVQRLDTLERTPLTFMGTDPHGAPASVEHFHAVSHVGSRTIIETIDTRGGGPAPREVDLADVTDTAFPVGVQFTRVVDGPDDTLLIGGGTIRALYDAIIYLQVAGADRTWFFENDLLFDGDAAYESATHWLGTAVATLHDEGIAPATPHVFFFGLKASGRTAEIILASAIPLEAVHPAILATGLDDAEFLVVWEASADRLDGVLVDCRAL